MTLGEIDEDLNNKIDNNEEFIVFSYYELRIKCASSKNEVEEFLRNSKNKLEKNNYRTYKPGEMYILNDKNRIVKENQLLVAVKHF